MKTLLLLIICPVLVSPLYASDSNYIKCKKYLNGINVEVEVESSKFNKNNHKIKKIGSNQISIDGLKPIGTPVIPTWEVSNFKIFVNGKSIDVPEYYYKNCYELNLSGVSILFSDTENIMISMNGSDGGYAYTVYWVIDSKFKTSRFIWENSEQDKSGYIPNCKINK